MTVKNTWKGLERKVAKILNGERIPCSGVSGIRLKGDVLHDRFFVECKFRERLFVYSVFQKAKEQASKIKKLPPLIPLLVLKQKYKKGELVVLDLNDFQRLIGLEKKEDENILEKIDG